MRKYGKLSMIVKLDELHWHSLFSFLCFSVRFQQLFIVENVEINPSGGALGVGPQGREVGSQINEEGRAAIQVNTDEGQS